MPMSALPILKWPLLHPRFSLVTTSVSQYASAGCPSSSRHAALFDMSTAISSIEFCAESHSGL
ncbi:hypothetical protein GGI06_006005 [Coemansia sp. S85]|nr:hypothetical protein GGI06_006005 [Coemansia sp. S85]